MKNFFFLDFRFNIEFIENIFTEYEEYFPRGLENPKLHHMATIYEQLQNSSFKGFLLGNDFTISMYNHKKEPKDRIFFHRLDQKAFSSNVHVHLPLKYNFLYSTLDRKVSQLVEGGFFVHWIDRYLSDSSLRKPEPEPDDDKVVLTMDHLSVGFIIWLGMLLIASGAFIAETARVHLANYLHEFFFQMILKKHQGLRRNH